MAGVSQAGPRRKYSWWWDSHISPKNSKWLQENLTDMDSKVKLMIKLIEEDADSFARRAEMYYKKRPELMKMVEEFYRAYRSLAERYDHATGVIRQAHRTIAEAFPNQVPFMLSDESPGFASEVDPHTPGTPHPGRATFDPERNGGFGDDSDPVTRRGPKQFGDVFGSGERFADGKARKVLNFQAAGEERDRGIQHNGTRSSDRMGKAEAEILNLKNALAKLESEKEAGLLQYEQSLERLSNLESEVSRAQNDSRELNERASKAEAEVRNLKGALGKLEAEREANLVQYRQYLEKISNLENSVTSSQKNAGELNERAQKAETEAEALKQDLNRVMAERDTVLGQYKKSLEMISKLQSKLVQTEEEARIINERVDKADCEVENLKQSFAKLAEEKETAVAQYLRCLETISTLEMKLARAYEEVEKLSSEVNNGVAKLKGAEEKCVALESSNRTLQLELESLVHKVGSQGDELTEKQKELGRLWTCVQEERLRFVEAETAFQTLHHLHSQSQEELRSMVSELQIKAENLNEMKNRSRGLELEVEKVKEENKSLNEVNLSSAVSIKNLQEDILSLRETIKRLEEEVELRVNQRNALQQEIYCLKEELNELSKKHGIMLEKVGSLGYDPEGFGSSVKDLQDENVKLMQSCEANQVEKLALLEQVKIMAKLIEKNAMLENSLADLNDELEGVREKVKVLEESCRSLLEEKSNLVEEKTVVFSQLRVTNETLEKLSEKNSVLASSLFEANTELEGLRVKSKSLEDSCLLIDGEKSCLVTEKEDLVSQLDHTRKILDDLGNRYAALEERLSVLQNDRENVIGIAEELRVQLDAEKTQHANFYDVSVAQLASRELQISRLQEGILCGKKEYEAEQDKALSAEIEILILLKFIQGLEEKHLGLLVERQKLLEASVKSKNLISEIQHENAGQKVDNKSLSEHNSILRLGLSRLMKILYINGNDGCDNKANQDQGLLNRVIAKVQETQDSLLTSFDEYQRVVTEKSVLVAILQQLESDGSNLMEDRNRIDRDCTMKSEEISALQVVRQEFFLSNEELKLKISEGEHRELASASKTEDLERQLVSLQSAYEILQKENVGAHEEKKSLTLKVSDLEEQRSCLEEEIHAMLGKTVFHSNLSLVFHDVISKNLVDLADLAEKLNRLDNDNVYLDEKARVLEEELEGARNEKLHLKEALVRSDSELQVVKSSNGRLRDEIVDTKDALLRKENDVEQLEDQADAYFADLQILKVREALLEGQVNEIVEACVSLEEESNSKSVEIELLKRKFGDANGELQAQVASYALAVVSLKSCIASLEKHTMNDELCNKHVNQVPEDVCLVAQNGEVAKTDEAQTTIQLDGISELEDLKRRIEAIEIAVTENKNAVELENMAAGLKLDAAVKEIEELKARGSSKWENGKTSKVVAASEGQEEQRSEPNLNLRVRTRRNKTQDIIELDNEVLTKDIVLDQISSDFSSYGRSKRQTVDGNSHLLELWETVDQDGSIDLTVGKARKSKNPSVESLMEKELGIDKLEISRRFSASSRQEGSKRRVLERLDSDAQKLSNLQITVQDLKRKVVEVTENGKKGKTTKYDTVKGQLDEAEEAITKLFDSNRKLTKNFEDGSQSSPDGIPATTSTLNESGSVRRRRISEQARRGSEKIGRLQMEVQRLQFLLLKLDSDEKEKSSRARIRVPDPKSRVLLRDYLYGGTVRTTRKHKKASFCSCVQPPTSS